MLQHEHITGNRRKYITIIITYNNKAFVNKLRHALKIHPLRLSSVKYQERLLVPLLHWASTGIISSHSAGLLTGPIHCCSDPHKITRVITLSSTYWINAYVG